ncbi:hypothetical protein CU052_11465 [Vibrio harveyi]|nr:hypothetical protein CU052_11465 [Vibrio harveyi]
MTSLLMKPTSAGKDTRHKRDQPLKKLAYVSNHWGPLLAPFVSIADSVLVCARKVHRKLTFAPL